MGVVVGVTKSVGDSQHTASRWPVVRWGVAAILAGATCGVGVLAGPAPANAPTTAPAGGDPNQNLQLEVDALSTLSDLQMSADQAARLRDLAKGTAGVVKPAEAGGDPQDIAATRALRTALLAGDEGAIDAAEQKLSEIEDQSDADLDPTVELSDAARSAAPAALKLMTPRQMADFLGTISDDIPDAADLMLAIDDSHELSQPDFAAERDRLAEDFETLTGGVHPARAPRLAGKVKQLLERARHTPDDQFAARTANLHAEAVKLLEGIDPILALRHCSERELAELLSNPQLPTALDEWKPRLQMSAPE
jgi:hypothetical protein